MTMNLSKDWFSRPPEPTNWFAGPFSKGRGPIQYVHGIFRSRSVKGGGKVDTGDGVHERSGPELEARDRGDAREKLEIPVSPRLAWEHDKRPVEGIADGAHGPERRLEQRRKLVRFVDAVLVRFGYDPLLVRETRAARGNPSIVLGLGDQR